MSKCSKTSYFYLWVLVCSWNLWYCSKLFVQLLFEWNQVKSIILVNLLWVLLIKITEFWEVGIQMIQRCSSCATTSVFNMSMISCVIAFYERLSDPSYYTTGFKLVKQNRFTKIFEHSKEKGLAHAKHYLDLRIISWKIWRVFMQTNLIKLIKRIIHSFFVFLCLG